MIPELVRHQVELEQLCRRYHVQQLDLFGSAAIGTFRSGESDLDFLVEFQSLPGGAYADTYFGLLEALEQLFGCAVDLARLRLKPTRCKQSSEVSDSSGTTRSGAEARTTVY
jgi:predicted nucleotidyltransferase